MIFRIDSIFSASVALWATVCCLTMASCGGTGRHSRSVAGTASASGEAVASSACVETEKAVFPYPVVPQLITDEHEKQMYFLEHYWDGVDFSDTLNLPSGGALAEAFYHYAEAVSDVRLVPYASACEFLQGMLEKASADTFVYRKFTGLCKQLYYDANSPLENDEYYIPVLQHEIACQVLTTLQKNKASYELSLVSRNRPGMKAADFTYTLASGTHSRLHQLKADYTLLLFHNPGCHACEELHSQLEESVLLKEMIHNGKLKVLAVFPDEDLKEWYDYRPQVPGTWINAYDKGTVVRQHELYDLKAIPMMYLLDSQKTVLLKDCCFRQLEDYFIAL